MTPGGGTAMSQNQGSLWTERKRGDDHGGAAGRHQMGGPAARRHGAPRPPAGRRAPHPLHQVGPSPALRPRRDRGLDRQRPPPGVGVSGEPGREALPSQLMVPGTDPDGKLMKCRRALRPSGLTTRCSWLSGWRPPGREGQRMRSSRPPFAGTSGRACSTGSESGTTLARPMRWRWRSRNWLHGDKSAGTADRWGGDTSRHATFRAPVRVMA